MHHLDPCDSTNESNSNYADDGVCSQDNVYRIYTEALHLSATMLLGVSNFHIVGKPELINLDFKGRPEDSMTIYLLSTGYMIVGLFLIALLISEANVYWPLKPRVSLDSSLRVLPRRSTSCAMSITGRPLFVA